MAASLAQRLRYPTEVGAAARVIEEVEAGGRSPNTRMTWVIFAIAWSLLQFGIASVFVLDATSRCR